MMNLFQSNLCAANSVLRVLNAAVKQCRANSVWATKRKPKTSADVALDYFDNIYSPIFGKQWPSIRLALLSPHKYCAVVNNYGDNDSLCTQLQNEGAINMRELFESYQNVLSKKKRSSKKKKELKHVYALDKKLEKIVAKQRDEELGKIYPEGAERLQPDYSSDKSSDINKGNLETEELIKQAKSPLEKSLSDANIDTNRQIDPAEGLSSSKLNEFVPVSKLIGKENFVSEAEHFSFFNEAEDFPVTVEPEESLHFPAHLQVYTFDQGNISTFTPSKSGTSGVLGYYLMDAGSVLPVLALGLRPGDTVLDMCAAPGGKSLLCLQTLYPDLVVCNDVSKSRLNRLSYIMQQYVTDWEQKVIITQEHGAGILGTDKYSKILVDVPCTTDRLSVMESDNNIFKPSRNKERILLPQLQVELLLYVPFVIYIHMYNRQFSYFCYVMK
ncbi:5-methylcytosine rRNA methyltransferase nsun4 [Homalodisca vitripennis]|nr:5-methylcytosine rRNA methyltransferase nsun4 [Homalodisca vitripennis]